MTLITAWITPKFRIIASDSKAFYLDGAETSFCQKIYAGKKIAVGIFGGSDESERIKLNNYFQENPNTNIKGLMTELEKIIKKKEIEDPHFVIVPIKGIAKIWIKHADGTVIRKKLATYKKQNQKYLPEEFFFSEILKNKETREIDFEYQNNLLLQFHQSQKETGFEDESVSNNSLLDLFKHFYSAVFYESVLYRNIIGGKIFLAFSINNHPWETADFEATPKDEYDGNKTFDFFTSSRFLTH